MTKTTFGSQPEPIQYMPLPGTDMADVWLRKNITAPEEGVEDACWTADEVYFRTVLSKAEIQEHFDTLFERDGLLTDPEPTPEERMAELEAQNQMLTQCLMEMSQIVYA